MDLQNAHSRRSSTVGDVPQNVSESSIGESHLSENTRSIESVDASSITSTRSTSGKSNSKSGSVTSTASLTNPKSTNWDRSSIEILYEADKNSVLPYLSIATENHQSKPGSPKIPNKTSKTSVYPSGTNLTARDAFGRFHPFSSYLFCSLLLLFLFFFVCISFLIFLSLSLLLFSFFSFLTYTDGMCKENKICV